VRRSVSWKPLALLAFWLLSPGLDRGQTNTNPAAREAALDAEELIGRSFSDAEIELTPLGSKQQPAKFEVLHRFTPSKGVPPMTESKSGENDHPRQHHQSG
jgi:hypothetical protein